MPNNENVKQDRKDTVDIKLNLNEYDNGVMSDFQKEFLSDELSALLPIENGQISIDGICIYDIEDKIEVSVYIRNGLEKQINFDELPLSIVNLKGEVLANQLVDMSDLGTIPPFSARPYKVYFDKENLLVPKIENDNWKIQFENNIIIEETVNVELEKVPESLPYELKNEFQSFLEKLPPLKVGEAKIDLFKVLKGMDNTISVIFMIRNGSDGKLVVNDLPITIGDENNKLVASGLFQVNNVCVNKNKARIYDFTIRPENIVNNDFDVTKCKVYFRK